MIQFDYVSRNGAKLVAHYVIEDGSRPSPFEVRP
jgi:hypothetical protein